MLNTFDRGLVDFVLLWRPFGGPPEEEIFPQFGLRPHQLERRFRRIVLRMILNEDGLGERDRALLATVLRAYPEAFETSLRSAAAQTVSVLRQPAS